MSQIVWVDLETTGVDEIKDPIIEIGAVLTDDTPEFTVISEFQRIVKPAERLLTIDRMDRDVIEMHAANGLVKALLLGEGSPVDEVDAALTVWLSNNSEFAHRLPLAGSGVSHFDRRFIRQQLPKFDKRLTYWAYDIGAVRRFLRLYGVIGDSIEQHEAKTHRALDDVKAHIEEARSYAVLLRGVAA